MQSLLRARPTPAIVLALVALVAALGGTATALPGSNTVTANDIKANAVRASEIKNNAVRTGEVKNGTLLREDFAPNQIPTGQGGFVVVSSALVPVPSGQTIRGAVGGDFHAADADASDFGVDVTLPMPAANPLSDNEVNVNVAGQQQSAGQTAATTTDTNAGCTGTPANPTAPAGEVCIYVSGADHAFNLAGYSVLFGTGASPYGFKLKWDASQEGDTFVDATWAYTAP